jgi:hypothetical protein
MRLLIALVIWLGAVVGAVAVSSTVAHSIHKTSASGSGGGGGGVDASTVKAAGTSSMFRTANLSHAVNTVRGHLGGSAPLTDAALYPGYLSMTAIKHGTEADVYVDVNGSYKETDTGGDPGSDRPFSLAKISANNRPRSRTGSPPRSASRHHSSTTWSSSATPSRTRSSGSCTHCRATTSSISRPAGRTVSCTCTGPTAPAGSSASSSPLVAQMTPTLCPIIGNNVGVVANNARTEPSGWGPLADPELHPQRLEQLDVMAVPVLHGRGRVGQMNLERVRSGLQPGQP